MPRRNAGVRRARRLTLEHIPAASEAPPLAALADRERLRQVLRDLLSHAIRRTPGGTVTIAARAGDAATVELRVRGTGIGIPAGKRGQLFEPFVPLDRSSTRRRAEGAGRGPPERRPGGGRVALAPAPGCVHYSWGRSHEARPARSRSPRRSPASGGARPLLSQDSRVERDPVSHRMITDLAGTTWQVWSVDPADLAGRFSVAVAPGYAGGWLAFEQTGASPGASPEKRRLAPVPAGWATAPEREMLALLASAVPVVARSRSTSRS